MKPIIELENIRRDFIVGDETVRALRGVTFSIAEGEFVTIMGTSGSGKSTLLNILGCLDTPISPFRSSLKKLSGSFSTFSYTSIRISLTKPVCRGIMMADEAKYPKVFRPVMIINAAPMYTSVMKEPSRHSSAWGWATD